ncbi:50S ribosomal protein L22 [Mycoplasmopsis synoviae]|uniref:Large ribosomal subunit protein uL22 n=2 Tax=Mycoplasmopsis synoviae TaxID=2109 RepID=A0AAQ0J5Y1_MYCSY|nr:50S ribosomal protein L22 [Mycoplasmopsis synoviae]UBM43992.1 50S ribosomal protein L22 [Mycoplasmopsis synoviae]UBX97770.1 50S ribosomal protein L22 [Mycoplasmopsis synoviae]UBX98414.1 50S ribosomal protein L22 [Mycoplasmopsis synoviae]UBX99074.1 50S ribosomal protein L22 [Mycoplasmopsis synoviae]
MMAQQAKAHVKMQRVSVSKAKLVANLFRGKDAALALGILHNTPQKSAKIFIKLLNSAIANATNNHGMDASKLFVKEIHVNEGPTLKRFQPRSQGRAYEILKRTSHFSIILEERA